MKITLCGSIAFFDEMLKLQTQLEQSGHEVRLPPTEVPDEQGNLIPVLKYYQIRKTAKPTDVWVWDRKAQSIHNHFDKIDWCDAILVLNETKHDVPNYIGGNTLMEMGVAFYLNKKIYLTNPIPEMSYTEEIIGMQPTVINHDLMLLRWKPENRFSLSNFA